MKLQREFTQQEVARQIGEERSSRMQAEAERLASLQKRLGAHEDLTTRRLEELKAQQDDALAGHRQAIDALLVEDKREANRRSEEMGRDHRASVASTKAEIQRLDELRERLKEDFKVNLEEFAAASEDGRAKLEERMMRE